jgi:hypothetical protein
MSAVVSYGGLFAILAILYGLRATLYLWVPSPRHIAVIMVFGFLLALPGVWFFSPDWRNPQMVTAGKWIGTPVAVLTVPCVSFLVDGLSGRGNLRRWYIRLPLEILIGVPAWAYLWALICLFILGWVWV